MPRPRRRKTPSPEAGPGDQTQSGAAPCAAPGCRLPAAHGSRFCVLHEMIDINQRRLEKQAKTNGDLTTQVLLFGLTWLGPVISKATQPRPAPTQARGPAGGGTPPPADPFAVLGLEKKGCTVEAVRRRQREFAGILHADKGGGPAATARLVEVNAAAAACLTQLKR